MSAASGKCGAILSALAFNSLSKKVGTPVVLWSTSLETTRTFFASNTVTVFFGCCIAGALFTLLLPEVKGRDPDEIDREEMRVVEAARRGQA